MPARDPRTGRPRKALSGAALTGAMTVVGALGAFGGPCRAAPPCPPAVVLEGDEEVTRPIAHELMLRGVSDLSVLSIPRGCPLLRASVERSGDRLLVTLLEVQRHRGARDISDPRMAAAYIESWIRHDLSAPLLQAPPPPPPPPTMGAPRWHAAAAAEAAYASDGSAWAGASVRGCARLGPVCPGAVVRFTDSVHQAGDTTGMTGLFGLDVLVGAEVPLRLGRVVLSPGAALGAGWLRAVLEDGYDQDVADHAGLRAEVRLDASVGLRWGLALDVGLSVSAAFLSGSAVPVMPAPMPPMMPPPMPPPMPKKKFSVPEAPWGFLRAAVGLSWSAL